MIGPFNDDKKFVFCVTKCERDITKENLSSQPITWNQQIGENVYQNRRLRHVMVPNFFTLTVDICTCSLAIYTR